MIESAGAASLDKCDLDFSGMDRSKLLYLGIRTQWEVERRSKCGDFHLGEIIFNLLALSDFVATLHRIKRKGSLSWWRSRITRGRKQKDGSSMSSKDKLNYNNNITEIT